MVSMPELVCIGYAESTIAIQFRCPNSGSFSARRSRQSCEGRSAADAVKTKAEKNPSKTQMTARRKVMIPLPPVNRARWLAYAQAACEINCSVFGTQHLRL